MHCRYMLLVGVTLLVYDHVLTVRGIEATLMVSSD
jgi:hypothetical protein